MYARESRRRMVYFAFQPGFHRAADYHIKKYPSSEKFPDGVKNICLFIGKKFYFCAFFNRGRVEYCSGDVSCPEIALQN